MTRYLAGAASGAGAVAGAATGVAGDDPYADTKPKWKRYVFPIILLVLAGAWYFGKLDSYLPNGARSVTVMGTSAPAYKAPVAVVVTTPAAAPMVPATPVAAPATAPAPEAAPAK